MRVRLVRALRVKCTVDRVYIGTHAMFVLDVLAVALIDVVSPA